jgi:hypothetical protein
MLVVAAVNWILDFGFWINVGGSLGSCGSNQNLNSYHSIDIWVDQHTLRVTYFSKFIKQDDAD